MTIFRTFMDFWCHFLQANLHQIVQLRPKFTHQFSKTNNKKGNVRAERSLALDYLTFENPFYFPVILPGRTGPGRL